MKIELKSLSFALAIMLVGVGCSSSTSSKKVENSEFKEARKLVNSLGSYSTGSRAKNSQKNSLGEEAGFSVVEDESLSSPMVVDVEGNIKEGGLFKFVNKEGHHVEIESKDQNVMVIKVDLNGDGNFSEDEIIVDKFSPIEVTPPSEHEHSVYGDELKRKLEAAEGSVDFVPDSEPILVRIDLVEGNYIYPVEMQRVNATGGATVGSGGGVTYYYGDKEISKEEMQQIQKEYEENERRRSEYRAKVNKENIEEFIAKNSIAKNDSIKNAIEAGFSHFELSLTKQEIKDLADTNRAWIYAITLPIDMGTDDTLEE